MPVPVQRRRLKVGAAAVLVALVVAVGGWLASSDEETGSQPSPAAEYSSR
ncbi:hypothetical protein HLB32_30520 [Streptomyces cacaoi]|nr:hypothetical protein [Streptomyces cacaoi]